MLEDPVLILIAKRLQQESEKSNDNFTDRKEKNGLWQIKMNYKSNFFHPLFG